jgi:hypothetical protein
VLSRTEGVQGKHVPYWSVDLSVSTWLREASVLSDSISLALDDDPTPEQASRIIQRTLVPRGHLAKPTRGVSGLHTAFSTRRLLSRVGGLERRRRGAAVMEGWVCDDWPQMVLDMISGTGSVRYICGGRRTYRL